MGQGGAGARGPPADGTSGEQWRAALAAQRRREGGDEGRWEGGVAVVVGRGLRGHRRGAWTAAVSTAAVWLAETSARGRERSGAGLSRV